MRRAGERRRQLKQWSGGMMKGMIGKLLIAGVVLVICTFSLFSSRSTIRSTTKTQIDLEELWQTAPSNGWKPSSAPRSDWPPPPTQTNGYLRVRCNGGLNQQRTAICNAVLAARIMNATLVLPDLDANSYWHDDSGFQGIYDVEHFIRTLRYDVQIVESIPEIRKNGKTKKMKAFQLNPPRDAPISWYTTVALDKMKEHGAIYLTPFSHRLAEEIDNPEYQRLRCRVNYHALRFKPHIMHISNSIVSRLRAEGRFMAIHLRFEMDMLAFAGCFDIFTPKEQKELKLYREKNFAPKSLIYNERRAIGKCPLTPEEVAELLEQYSSLSLFVGPPRGLTLKTTTMTAFAEKPAGEKADAVRTWVQQNKSLLNSWRAKTISLANSDKTTTPIEEILEKKANTLWQVEKFWIQAVLSQLSEKDIYCYVGCGSCGRTTTEELGAKFTCRSCRTVDSVASFRASMNTMAADVSSSIKVTAFTKEVELICGLKCEELTALKHNENPEPFSKLLEQLRKKEMLLQISPTNALTISNTLKWTIRQVDVPAGEP